MASAARLESVFESMPPGAVPASRTVPDLEAALGLVRQLGGSVASEIRTAPGIGSWAFVAGSDGSELLLWETAAPIGF
jgi:predicted enzyme related to lactoylglutathione lyase